MYLALDAGRWRILRRVYVARRPITFAEARAGRRAAVAEKDLAALVRYGLVTLDCEERDAGRLVDCRVSLTDRGREAQALGETDIDPKLI